MQENGVLSSMDEHVRVDTRSVPSRPAVKLAITAILTSIETVATMLLVITIPASDGYFNVGEGLIYFTAICFGPWIGGFVGGVGAALADIFLGYTYFAPATFLAKGLEGIVVGSVFRVLKKSPLFESRLTFTTVLIGAVIGGLMIGLGWGVPMFLILGLVLMVGIWILGLSIRKDTVKKVLAMVCGGCVMVTGYFLYEIPLFGIGAAVFELPFNALQVLLGILIAIPLISALEPLIKPYFQ
jgi:uncharacterized membrane protein